MIIYNKTFVDRMRRDISVSNIESARTTLNASKLTEINKQFLKSLNLIVKNND